METELRPYVISWNLTYRCNLACEHCYLDAGAPRKLNTPNFADRRELDTKGCLAIVDQIADFAPEAVTILTGGEPLLRRDILEIVTHAAKRELWVVIGTNGVRVTPLLVNKLTEAGVRGMALSIDALDPVRHDSFRAVEGSWDNTVSGAKVLRDADLPFIIQTTVGTHNANELEEIAHFAQSELGAKVWNLYFLVQTGRGQFVSDVSNEEYEEVLATLSRIQQQYRGQMMVNAKCAPHYSRVLFEQDRSSPFLKTFTNGAGGCPAGTHYMGIRPNGDMTPCPYLPEFAGNLRTDSLGEIWQKSEIFTRIRDRSAGLGGRCGACEFKGICGGCRARAYGQTTDYMAEDPLCSYEPGRYEESEIPRPEIVYGQTQKSSSIEWDAEARERIKKIPAFVRGTVVGSVERYCLRENIERVTVKELDEIRERMPFQKVFSGRKPPLV